MIPSVHRWLRFAAALTATAGLLYVLGRPVPIQDARVPPPGKFLEPYAGVWRRAAPGDDPPPSRLTVPGLRAPVTISWDERGVPHVFAQNARDLYFVQGWVTARDRLWQMDFQARVASGRLSEIVGAQGLAVDRHHRRIGMAWAAERARDAMLAEAESREAVEAYADGVNAWIASLDPARLPLEYKLLDHRPERWTPLHTAQILKGIALLLSGNDRELAMSRALHALGPRITHRLYPDIGPYTEPIVPAGTAWEFEPLPTAPPAPRFPPPDPGSAGEAPADRPDPDEPDALGSNNWALAGTRTASGRPILAGDPHLPLQLPSTFYEIQLSGPAHRVYGVSLPGFPGVVVGFNDHVAWSTTNAETDVSDWLRVDLDGERWRGPDGWRPLEWREETILVRDGAPWVERVPMTAHGPVPAPPGVAPTSPEVPVGAALRWSAHDPSNELAAALALNRARGVLEVAEALARFECPPQNFAFATDEGDIGVVHAGTIPVRWRGQGQFVGDGADPSFSWPWRIPTDQLPAVFNPPRGWVASANQTPTDDTYPYFLGGSHAPFERATRIRELLEPLRGATPIEVAALQVDDLGVHARALLPVLLAAISVPPLADLSDDERAALQVLSRWDYRFRPELVAPTVFDYWQREVSMATWRDDLETGDGSLRIPRRDVTLQLVRERPGSAWFDDRSTPEREVLQDVARSSFRTAVATLAELYGSFGESWRWGRVRGTDIRHVARIPGLGIAGLEVPGQYGVVRATTGSAGQAWRMVVELGDPPMAWGVLPGGETGDPGSLRYAEVGAWVGGVVRPLTFARSSEDDVGGAIASRTRLEPAP